MNTEALKKLIGESGKTQKEIAAELNLSRQRFNHYVNGQREPDLDTLVNMASCLKVSLNELISIDEESAFWASPYIQAIKKYCDVTGKPFQDICDYFFKNPIEIEKWTKLGRVSLPANLKMREILGMDPHDALILGCSNFSSMEEYEDYYNVIHGDSDAVAAAYDRADEDHKDIVRSALKAYLTPPAQKKREA